ncbi:MAG: glycosyltransferase family 9 protein [Burkholderiales bacterium]
MAQQKDPRRVRIMHSYKVPWSEVWENNPRLAKPVEQGDFQLIYGRSIATNMRPYHTGKTQERWSYNLAFRPDVGELYLTDAELEFGSRYQDRLVLEPHIKPGASPNKSWGWDRWQRLAKLFIAAGMPVTQVGVPGTLVLEGAEFVPTATFRMACGVIAFARAVVLQEGGAHHAAAALGVPGVVIFGGFTPVELTGYACHQNLGVSLGDACGNRQPCQHCFEIMAGITPGRVFDETRGILRAA